MAWDIVIGMRATILFINYFWGKSLDAGYDISPVKLGNVGRVKPAPPDFLAPEQRELHPPYIITLT